MSSGNSVKFSDVFNDEIKKEQAKREAADAALVQELYTEREKAIAKVKEYYDNASREGSGENLLMIPLMEEDEIKYQQDSAGIRCHSTGQEVRGDV